jgi:hypothetical protein
VVALLHCPRLGGAEFAPQLTFLMAAKPSLRHVLPNINAYEHSYIDDYAYYVTYVFAV